MNATHQRAVDRDFERFCDCPDDVEALGRVFDATAGRLLVAAGHLSQDASAAEDLVQATFVTAIEARDRFERGSPVFPWLLGILANRSRSEGRRQSRRSELDALHGDGLQSDRETSEPSRLAATREAVDLLADAIESLPDATRQVLALRLTHGLGPTEIAQALGRPLATVKSQLARGADALRRTLPAGLAPAVAALVVPERGLAAVRSNVLSVVRSECAAAAPAAGASAVRVATAVLSGSTMRGAVVAAACAVLVALLGWSLLSGPDNGRAPSGSAEGPALSAVEERSTAVASVAPGSLEGGRRRASSVTESDAVGRPVGALRIRLRFDRDPRGKRPNAAPVPVELAVRVYPEAELDGRLSGKTLACREDAAAHVELSPGRYVIWLSEQVHATALVEVGELSEVVLDVPSCGTLRGIVLDEFGRALRGCEVCFQDDDQSVVHVLDVTGTDGRFAARMWRPWMRVFARRPGMGRSESEMVRSVPGESHDVLLRLSQGAGALRGMVRSAATGEGVAGATVYANVPPARFSNTVSLEMGNSMDRVATTAEDGSFVLSNVRPGAFALLVRAPGDRSDSLSFLRTDRQVASLEEPLDLELPEALPLRGAVLTATGTPVPGAWVTLQQYGMPGYLPRCRTAGDGTFDLGAVVRSVEGLELIAEHPAFGVIRERLPSELGELEIRFGARGRIVGRLVSEEPAASLAAWRVDASAGRGSEILRTACDARGHFCLSGCVEAGYDLSITRPVPGGRIAYGWSDIVPDRAASDSPLEFRIEGERLSTARVRGFVTVPPGFSAERVRVSLSTSDSRTWITTVARASDGGYEIGPVPAGSYRVGVSAPGLQQTRAIDISLQAHRVFDVGPVELRPATGIHLDLRGPGAALGLHPPVLSVLLEHGHDGGRIASTNRWFGRWLEDWRLEPGKFRLRVSGGPRNLPQEIPIELFAGKVTTVPLDMPELHPVKFQVVTGEGVDLPRFCSFAFSGDDAPLEKLSFGADRVLIRALPRGRYRLELSGVAGLRSTHVFEVPAGSSGEGQSERLVVERSSH